MASSRAWQPAARTSAAPGIADPRLMRASGADENVIASPYGKTKAKELAGIVRGGRFTPDANARPRFRPALEQARAKHDYGAAVAVKDPEFYDDPTTRLFLSDDGLAGVAVAADGELVSVFKDPDSVADVGDLLRVVKVLSEEGHTLQHDR